MAKILVEPSLRRSLSLPVLVLYGLGTTVGAGIYALTGKIAGVAGTWAPAAFLVSSTVAAFTALSFAELSSRYPKSAGEAVYLQAGFQRRLLAQLGGSLVVLSGIASSATLIQAAFGYANELFPLPHLATLLGLIGLLTALVCWGIRESVGVAAALTVLEVGGIVLISAVGAYWLWENGQPVATAATAAASAGTSLPVRGIPVAGILSGAVLGFYAFLGFEDMVNVAEEVKQPTKTLPRAIVATLVITTLLYIVLASIAVSVVSPAELAASSAPLTLLYARADGAWPNGVTGIALAGMLNGILIQMIMASRVLYGLAQEGAAPAWLGHVHRRTRTPVFATLLIGAAVFGLAANFPVERLARATSWMTLVLFAFINWALVRVQKRQDAPAAAVAIPRWVPILGAWLCAGMVLREVFVLLTTLR